MYSDQTGPESAESDCSESWSQGVFDCQVPPISARFAEFIQVAEINEDSPTELFIKFSGRKFGELSEIASVKLRSTKIKITLNSADYD